MNDLLMLTMGTGADGAGVGLWAPGRPPATGQLPPDWAAQVGAQVDALLAPPAGLLLAAGDVDSSNRERRAAEALAGMADLPGVRELRDALVRLAAGGQAPRLAIDARQPALRALPWELLAGLPPGRSPLAAAEVLRLQPQEPRGLPAPTSRLVLRLWAPEPDDPVVAQALARVAAWAAGQPRVLLERVPPRPRDAAPVHGGPAVLHLLSHGLRGLGGVGLSGSDGPRAAETITRLLGPWLDGCALALADICAGAGDTADPADAPVWRLSMQGLPVVVGPRHRWAVDASEAFRGALFAALLAGDTVSQATERGRTALRQLAVGHPSCRWWTPLAVVSTPVAARLRAVRPAASVPGWPDHDPDADPLLARALGLARGYLGVEHLLAAAADPGVPLPPALAPLRPALTAVAGRHPPLPLDGPPRPTTRMAALGAELPAAFSCRELLRRLALVPWVAATLDPAARARLLAPDQDDGHGTLPLEPIAAPPPADAALGLLVEGEAGPEDGRLLHLRAPGDLLGRWDPARPDQVDGRLFCHRSDGDRTLSRSHLLLVQGRRVDVRGLTRLLRPGAPERPLRGPVDLQPGDLLILGAGTRLRVR